VGSGQRYTTADLSESGRFGSGSQDVVYSAGGTSLATATAGSTELFQVFNAASASITSHSTASGPSDSMIDTGTLHYSADGTLLYAIARDGYDAELVTATTQTVAKSRLTASVSSPAKYGQAAKLQIATGRAHSKVTLVVTSDGRSQTVSRTTTAAGKASIPITSAYNSDVTITDVGDLRHATKTLTRSFKVPAKLSIAPTGFYSSRGGIRHYHSIAAVHVDFRDWPQRQMALQLALQIRINGQWLTTDAGTYTTTSDGRGAIILKSGNKGRLYRVVLKFAGDSFNRKAPTVTSTSFIVD